ncbi:MAG: precorrin-8X methylmutase [Anaerolineae bacterium]
MNASPHDIERESFRIIQQELGEHAFSPQELTIVTRVIHATADFEYRRLLRFHPHAIASGIAALRRGATIVTDVQMVQVGIGDGMASFLNNKIVCDIRHPEVYAAAKATNTTRAALGMRHNAARLEKGIAVIGNAPTALLEVIRLVETEDIRPALIVGVPVGFVNAAESKAALAQLDVPHITTVGRKGGSTVAAAIVNALLRMAMETERAEPKTA